MGIIYKNSSIGETVRKAERDYTSGVTTISKYVQHSLYETIEKIYAYLHSSFTSSAKDSLGRDKPFFNIVRAAANIWFRATAIKRRDIKVRAGKRQDWLNSLLATAVLQDWMKRSKFGLFLVKWGITLARFGSAVVKFVKKEGELVVLVIPWNKIIIDAVDFDSNPKIEILELTEAQLRENENYDQNIVDGLIAASQTRETLDKKKKDTKENYYKLYEVHGDFSLATYKKAKGLDDEINEGDSKIFFPQMHVLSYVGGTKEEDDNQDFLLYSGREEKCPYMLTHLIEEDDRALAMGAVEHLFESQWMVNHTAKAIKDQLDLASKLVFQTADTNFVGKNVLTSIENGTIMVHAPNQPLTQMNNNSHDTSALREYQSGWKQNGREIVGISEAMLGAQPKSGTAWRQTEAILQENHNLFGEMTDNKGLHLEDMMREHIIPFLKTKLDTSEEVSAVLEGLDLKKIDARYIKNISVERVNERVKQMMIRGEQPHQDEQMAMKQSFMEDAQATLREMGNERFFKPSEISNKTWKEQFKNFEWEVEIDITGEQKNTQEAMTTLATALKVVMDPAYEQNEKAQMIVGNILELAGAISPLQLADLQAPVPVGGNQGQAATAVQDLADNTQEDE